jgi:hypothetical protein
MGLGPRGVSALQLPPHPASSPPLSRVEFSVFEERRLLKTGCRVLPPRLGLRLPLQQVVPTGCGHARLEESGGFGMATVATRRRADLPLVVAPGEQPEQESERGAAAAPSTSFEEVTPVLRPKRTVAVRGLRQERPQKATGVERRIALGITALGFCLLVGLVSARTPYPHSASSVSGYAVAAQGTPGDARQLSGTTVTSSAPKTRQRRAPALLSPQ